MRSISPVTFFSSGLNKEGYIALSSCLNIICVVAELVIDPNSLHVAPRLDNLVAGVKQTEHLFYQFTVIQVIEKAWTMVVNGEATGSHQPQ